MKKTFLHSLGIIGLLLMSISANGANYARVTISKSSVSTGDGKIYISTANAKPLEPNTQATSSKADTDYQEKTFYFWADAETGSHFVGWADANDKQDVIANSDVQPYTENFKAAGGPGGSDKYADYNRYAVFFLNTYTIAFDKNAEDATGTTESVNATYSIDATLTANGFEREGWNFDGWNTQADGLGTAYGEGAIVKNLTAEHEATVTLYAQWSQSAVDPNFVQNITSFNPYKSYNNVIESSNKESALTLSVANESEAGVAKFLADNVLYVYKMGTFDIVANQPEVAGKFNAVVDKVVATCTVTTATWEWTPDDRAAGEFYLLNSKYNNQDNFLKATSAITTDPAEATKFTFTSATSSTISYVENGTTKYVAQNNGNAAWGTNSANWAINAATNADLDLGQGSGWKFSNQGSWLQDNRTLSINNNTGVVNYIKDNWNINFYVWNYISVVQMNAYLYFTQLSEYVSSKAVSVALKDKAVETLFANGLDSEYPYATKAGNLKAVIDAYDAYAEVKDFLDNVSGHDDQKADALAALEVATTTEAIYAAKRMIVFPLTLVAQNNEGYWATFSGDYDVEFSVGVTVYTVTVNGEEMVLHKVEDRQVPAHTGVLIKSANTEISYVSVAPVAALENNMLLPGTGAETTSDVECRFYRLAYYDYAAKTGLGFYYGPNCDDGQAFKCKAGTAYLAVPKTTAEAPARFLLDRQDISTDLLNVNVNDNQGKKVMMNGVLYIIRDGKTYDSFGRLVK